MDVKCLLNRIKEIKMPKEMEKRIVENILNFSNSFANKVQDSGRMVNREGDKSRKIVKTDWEKS